MSIGLLILLIILWCSTYLYGTVTHWPDWLLAITAGSCSSQFLIMTLMVWRTSGAVSAAPPLVLSIIYAWAAWYHWWRGGGGPRLRRALKRLGHKGRSALTALRQSMPPVKIPRRREPAPVPAAARAVM